MLSMRMRVWVEKVMLVRHLRTLDPSTLARRIYEEQKEKKWPGLVKETEVICQNLGMNNCNEDNLEQIGTRAYRKKLIEKCKEKDQAELRKMAEGKVKCDRIMTESYGRKEYLSTNVLRTARQIFLSRTKMHQFAANYPKDKRFARSNWMCRCKTEKEEETHLRSGKCAIYGDLKDKYPNLEDDNQLAKFFSSVLDRRTRLEEQDKQTTDALVVGTTPSIVARHSGVPPVAIL